MIPYSLTKHRRGLLSHFWLLIDVWKNSIILNREKFQFCQDVVQFGGLQITSSGVTPWENLLNAISSFLGPKIYHWYKVIVWSSQSISMGIFTESYNAANLGPCKKKNFFKNFVRNENLKKAFLQSKQIIVGLVKKRSYHFQHQQGNLPSSGLEQGRYGLPVVTEALHIPNWESPSMLSRWMVHCIYKQQILHWHRTPVGTHWGKSSHNCLDITKMLHICHWLPKSNSSNWPSATNRNIWWQGP